MPYINKERRRAILNDESPATLGELNYVIYKACYDYLNTAGLEWTYERLNNVVGVLECSKQEFYRRLLAPLEDQKIFQNGDIE